VDFLVRRFLDNIIESFREKNLKKFLDRRKVFDTKGKRTIFSGI
jgi:hypothetical protein